jgi:hypothetical protein
LGEVAQIVAEPALKQKLEQISIGETPVIGVPRSLFEGHIAIRLRMAGIKPESYRISVPAQAVVTRRCQRIAQDQFVQVARAAAKEKLGIELPTVCKDKAADFPAPMGTVELTAETCSKTTNGVTVVISIRVDGKRVNSRVVNLSVDTNAQGVKAGDTVKIQIQTGGATFEIGGKTRSAGWVGQTVTVVTDTGSVHTATVVSSSVVQVKL